VVCPHCGHRNPEGGAFCASCGGKLSASRPDETTATIIAPVTPPAVESDDDDIALAAGDLEAGSAVLVVRRGPNVGERYLLDRDVTRAGRHPDSDIFLDDITVSRRHAEVHRLDGRYTLRDTGSLNGTYLNRERIDDAPLVSGDEVQIGKYRLMFLSAS
jgi:pSer/pThr/pTyr-binding forkhead associated (FHA) protein